MEDYKHEESNVVEEEWQGPPMNLVQWRCFVAYLSHWYPMISVKDALKDLKIDMEEDDALWEVKKCGYSFSYEAGLKWEEN